MATLGPRQCKARLAKICARLPETGQRPGGEGGRHIAYLVRAKTFAYFTDDHHGDGRLALISKAPPGAQAVFLVGQASYCRILTLGPGGAPHCSSEFKAVPTPQHSG